MTMNIDCYRLAYNVFHRNWIKFGIPEKNIPPPETDEVDSLGPIIPEFSNVVVLFQIASRKDLKLFFDKTRQARNLDDLYTSLQDIMKEVLPEGAKGMDLPEYVVKDILPVCTMVVDGPKDATDESISEETTEEFLTEDIFEQDPPEDIMEMEDLPEDIKTEDQSIDAMTDQPNNIKTEDQPNNIMTEDQPKDVITGDQLKDAITEDQPKDTMTGDQPKDIMTDQPKNVKKHSLPDHIILSKDVPWLIAYSLAICVEIILYKYKNNKIYMQYMPKMWEKYFNENLKRLCDDAKCTEDRLKDAISGLKCPEKFLDEFIAANKKEYENIEEKFYEYTKKNCAVESPESSNFIIETKFPTKLTFLKVKEKVKKICICLKYEDPEKRPLLASLSSSSNSSQTSPMDTVSTTL